MNQPNTIYEIRYDFDLNGATLEIPDGCTLKFEGGMLKNGNLIGNKTIIKAKDEHIFNNITIKGYWLVRQILSVWFEDCNKVDKLYDIFALSNPDLYNEIILDKTEYILSTPSKSGYPYPFISVNSNTHIILNGNVRLMSFNQENYSIFDIKNIENVIIEGTGTIKGERDTHIGDSGEWGHGVNIISSEKITIKGITIRDCWGDGIYIGGNGSPSKNISIVNTSISNNRRQGISITHASVVRIKNNVIKDTNGTDPQFGVDIEPNKNEYAENIFITGNIISSNQNGAIMTYSNAGLYVKNVYITNNILAESAKALNIDKANTSNIYILNNTIKGIIYLYADRVTFESNNINGRFFIYGDACQFSKNYINYQSGNGINGKYTILTKNYFYSTRVADYGVDCLDIKNASFSYIANNIFVGNIGKGYLIRDNGNNCNILVGNLLDIGGESNRKCWGNSNNFVASFQQRNSGKAEEVPDMDDLYNSYDYSQAGFSYYQTDTNIPIFWNGHNWYCADGQRSDAKRYGEFSNKPTDVNDGFQYFNSDTRKVITFFSKKWWNPDGTEATE